MRTSPYSTARAALLGTALGLPLLAGPARAQVFFPGDLVISSSTYDNTQGAVANLTVGTPLAGTVTTNSSGQVTGYTPSAAAAGNDYTTVWNNASPDGSFGVTSEITLQDVNPTTGVVKNALNIPTNAMVTSFSSKSEVSLNLSANGQYLSFMGYQSPGVGALDISNSDTPGIPDPTNPVTQQFGSGHATARAIATVDAAGFVAYTPTNAYSGNNGRSAVLAPNGLFYTVGNSNNGATKVSNAITTHTGLEVVTPNPGAGATVASPETPTQINSGYTSIAGDKFGKDNNFRGVTLYNGNLYFTKGSGSNGIDTVYTVSNPGGALPTAGTASSAAISILPGFPTGAAKPGADYTPFGLFFANPNTLYVSDEGSGDATDATTHAGLEKWSFDGTKWNLDYTLQSGLLGTSYTLANSTGGDPYPTVTTAGLRDITGQDNPDGTVTIWGVTSTSSASGDQGADPNEVVSITDNVADTTLPGSESFSVLEAPVYGLVYRGVAEAPVPEPASLALLGVALVGLGLVRRSSFKMKSAGGA